jgi:hypothetical protein
MCVVELRVLQQAMLLPVPWIDHAHVVGLKTCRSRLGEMQPRSTQTCSLLSGKMRGGRLAGLGCPLDRRNL